jgi:hypothetical protein
MASLSRETRQKQLAEWELKLHKRQTLLGEKGLDAKMVAHDIGVRQLKSKIKESQARIGAIDALEKRTAELAAMKAERLAKPKEEAHKAKKAVKPPPETKPTEKKKKKESAGPQKA